MNSAKYKDTRLIFRSLLYLFTLTMKCQKVKNKQTKNHFKTASENKISRNKPNHQVKGLSAEKYKTQIRETEDDPKKWKDIPCLWTGRSNV